MNPTKRLAGPCSHCGRTIEYPAQLVGTMAKCPYCAETTELRLAEPPQESSVPKRVVVFTAIAILILVLALVACFAILKWAQTHSGRKVPMRTNSLPTRGLQSLLTPLQPQARRYWTPIR